MAFRGKSVAPAGYVPGLGRGALGFTTRSDVGPMSKSLVPGDGSADSPAVDGLSGSRSAEMRAMKLKAKKASVSGPGPVTGMFGVAPQGYVPGAGRGAGGMMSGGGPGGAANDDGGNKSHGNDAYGMGGDTANDQYDEDDDEADAVWAAIDERMNSRRRKRKKGEDDNDNDDSEEALASQGGPSSSRARIGLQFRELKEKLADVTEDQWASIPDVGDYSLKYKQKQQQQNQHGQMFTPITDSLLEQRTKANADATSGNAQLSANTAVGSGVSTSMSGVGAARGTVLGMSLDKMSDSVLSSGQKTVVDPQGYLTSLSNTKIATNAEVSDINKARLLLKSVRETNPKHGPGWIASARVEEAAGKTLQARKLIQEGCEVCPTNEDVWLEAARLHPPEVAKTILATAVRRIPNSVKIFMRAADLEHNDKAKKQVLRKALESNSASVTLWKAAIELEDANDAKILLAVAVEKIPHSVEMWLALARLETYQNAQKVLNKARKALPAERAIWIAAAKLEESQNHEGNVDKLIDRAVKALAKHDAVITRSQWLQEAENAEAAGAPLTSAAIIKHTVGNAVDPEDRQRTWADDAKGALARGYIATSRAILSHSLAAFPTKRSLWMQTVELERKHGTAQTLDEVLAAASERLPRAEIFWLLRAKERWLQDDVDKAREILTKAFAANPDSEQVWLAAAKLEWETGEIERAEVLLSRARERAPTARVYMKSALLQREQNNFDKALELIEQGIDKYPDFAKLYMMGGQICSDDFTTEETKNKANLDRARKFYQRGLQQCPNNVVLWTLASRLEERAHEFSTSNNGTSNSVGASTGGGVTKARGLLEIARLKNGKKNAFLWLEAIRLERRHGNDKLAKDLTARALQECPNSGVLLAENIRSAPRVEQKSKSADAIKRCPEDPMVITAVASLFASEHKTEKARKWFERSVILNPDMGDSWVQYYAFEQQQQSGGSAKSSKKNQNGNDQKVKERCVAAEPRYGELWTSVRKDMMNRRKNIAEVLEVAATQYVAQAKAQREKQPRNKRK